MSSPPPEQPPPLRAGCRLFSTHALPPKGKQRSGFAVIIALTLTSFIILLLLSLTAFVLSETRGARAHVKQTIARQNARLGMLSALNELQKQAGPDQRVTATAALEYNGKLAAPQNANWVGVYDSDPKSGNYGKRVKRSDGSQGWLISHSPNSKPLDPQKLNSKDIIAADGLSKNPDYAVVVGGGTAGFDTNQDGYFSDNFDDSHDLDGDAKTKSLPENFSFVVAAKIPLDIPNLDTNSSKGGTMKIGSHAWWVGDEGVKADYTIPYLNSQKETEGTSPYIYNKKLSERVYQIRQAGGTSFSRDALFNAAYNPLSGTFEEKIFDQYQPNDDLLLNTLNIGQLPLIEGIESDLITAKFHNFTSDRIGILTNTVDGGLKMNLEDPDGVKSNSDFPNDNTPSNIFTNGALAPNNNGDYFITEFPGVEIMADPPTYYGPTIAEDFDKAPELGTATDNVTVLKAAQYYPLDSYFTDKGSAAHMNGILPEHKPYNFMSPIITEFRMRFSVFEHTNANLAQIRFYAEAEIYNPMPYHISPNDDGPTGNNKRSFTIKVTDLPEINVIGPGGMTGWVKLEDIKMNNQAHETAVIMNIGEDPVFDNFALQGYLRGGEVFQLEEPDQIHQSEGLIKWIDGSIGGPVAPASNITIMLRPPAGTVGPPSYNVQLLEDFNHDGLNWRDDINPVFEIVNIPYAAPKVLTQNASENYLPGGNPDLSEDYSFAFHYRFKSGIKSTDTEAPEWLGSIDMRHPRIDYTGTYQDREGNSKNFSSIIQVPQPDPFLADTVVGQQFSLLDLFADRLPGSANRDHSYGSFRDIRPYDYPIPEGNIDNLPPALPSSVSHLRVFPLSQVPPYALGDFTGRKIKFHTQGGIGNPANNLNMAFDRYFFSTVPTFKNNWNPSDTQDDRGPLPNPRLLLYPHKLPDQKAPNKTNAQLRSWNAAKDFLVEGMFNINSISVDAWQSLLSQNVYWEFREITNATKDHLSFEKGRKKLHNAFFRLPCSGTNNGVSFQTDEEISASFLKKNEFKNFGQFRQPGRSLNGGMEDGIDAEDTGVLQIRQLSWHIVDLVKKHGPFTSLADFINQDINDLTGSNPGVKGLIQAAIDRVGVDQSGPNASGINNTTPINKDIVPYSNAYLTQGDVISAIDRVMSPRSDTFLIRSYGDYTNPLTEEIEARAYMEAKVQRLVEKIDPGKNPVTKTETASSKIDTFRRFKIISVRWLNESDI